MLLHLFIAALWSSVGKGLTYWLLFVMFISILLPSHLVSRDCIDSWSLLSFLLRQLYYGDLCNLDALNNYTKNSDANEWLK